jgi:hypothetical protein
MIGGERLEQEGRVEKANRKTSSRGLRPPMNSAIAARACGILRSMLPEVSTIKPSETGTLKSLRKKLKGALLSVLVQPEIVLGQVRDVDP